MCLNYDNCSKFNNRHNWGGGALRSLKEHMNLHFDNE